MRDDITMNDVMIAATFHWLLLSGKASIGQGGQSAPIDSKKEMVKNREKERKNQEKTKKNRKNRGRKGQNRKVLSLCPS